jgi:transcriptional regulator with GAF, ATPase, and Fis domain
MERQLNPRLVGISGPVEGGTFALGDDEISIGRDNSNSLPIDEPSISRRHCSIRKLAADQFEICDLGSKNGTAVNGLPIVERVLGDRDEISVGDCRFLFLLSESNQPPNPVSIQFDETVLDTGTTVTLRQEGRPLRLDSLLDEAAAHSRVSARLAVLIKIGAGIQMAQGVPGIARLLLERIFEAIPAERGAVLLFEGARDEPVFAYSCDRDGRPSVTVSANIAIVTETRREGIAILASSPLLEGQSRRVLVAPIMSQDKTLGVIYLEACDPRAFDDEHLQLATSIGSILGMPFENARRLEWLEAEACRLQEAIDIEHGMLGAGPRMRDVFQFVGKVAPTASTILIRGESGTGKELVARAIHRNSPRARQRFVAINCAALTETLLESELFGHEKGAFTGAVVQKQGKLEIADGGTLFLDEVGELPLSFQTKLLRVLQEREFERVGGTRPIRVDVRLIAATNRDLESAMAINAFRKDLYYRLNVVSVAMPPLRDRREDIPLLARHFAAKHSKRTTRRLAGLSPEALACLEAYDWPGNVRELENAIERATVLGSTELILPEDLPEAILDAPAASQVTGGYYQTVREEKKRAILAALARSGGNYTEAAKQLAVHPNYLHRLVRNLDLKGEVKKALSG